MSAWSRRRSETMLLAGLSLLSVLALRIPVENQWWLAFEIVFVALATFLAMQERRRLSRWGGLLLPVIPWVFAILTRQFATPVAFELSALSSFGCFALAMAIIQRRGGLLSLSLVTSGFLVLFVAAISDHRYAFAVPLIWVLGCLSHLVANQWERLDVAMPETVCRNWTLRPGTLVFAIVLLVTVGYAVVGRVTASKRLNWGIMPTSGGSSWSDPAARSGIGSGLAAVAAKDHAESFGAVDTDLFLESTESTLFDMVNDTIGEPLLKKRWERMQAMGNETIIPTHERVAKSERGGGSFTVDRLPPKKHVRTEDAAERSVIQWDGPTGIRLAMQRYDTFRDDEWTQSADVEEVTLSRVMIGENAWFVDPRRQRDFRDRPESVEVGLLKVIRLKSARIPAPGQAAGVHIKDIDRQDFFAMDSDGCFCMPGRDAIPPLTVAHIASASITEDEIRAKLRQELQVAEAIRTGKQSTSSRLVSLTREITEGHQRPYDRLQAIVKHLRTEFVFDRHHASDAGDSIEQFLHSRRGGDHLFATVAALMAREIGFRTRLVTGFYVRPDSYDFAAGHASVLPDDVHVWAEVQLVDGRWIELEATPGFRLPDYRCSWWLATRRQVAEYWPAACFVAVLGMLGWVTRRIWIDWWLRAVWQFASALTPKRKVWLAMRIIETRARLAGQRRPAGRSQRAWLEQLTHGDATVSSATRQFLDSADALFFGSDSFFTHSSVHRLVDLLRIDTISQLTNETSQ